MRLLLTAAFLFILGTSRVLADDLLDRVLVLPSHTKVGEILNQVAHKGGVPTAGCLSPETLRQPISLSSPRLSIRQILEATGSQIGWDWEMSHGAIVWHLPVAYSVPPDIAGVTSTGETTAWAVRGTGTVGPKIKGFFASFSHQAVTDLIDGKEAQIGNMTPDAKANCREMLRALVGGKAAEGAAPSAIQLSFVPWYIAKRYRSVIDGGINGVDTNGNVPHLRGPLLTVDGIGVAQSVVHSLSSRLSMPLYVDETLGERPLVLISTNADPNVLIGAIGSALGGDIRSTGSLMYIGHPLHANVSSAPIDRLRHFAVCRAGAYLPPYLLEYAGTSPALLLVVTGAKESTNVLLFLN